MPSSIGPHLLGRRVSPFDARDYPLDLWLKDAPTPLEDALKTLLSSHAARATKSWAQIATPLILGQAPPAPAPAPQPGPTPGQVLFWPDPDAILDQGDTPHCVGFGGAQWGNTLPVDDHFVNGDGDRIYYACKDADGEPGAEDGSDVRTLAKVLQAEGLIHTYAWAKNVDQGIAFLPQGPLIAGTDWYTGMFSPDSTGLVKPTGVVEGGHCYVKAGYDPSTERVRCRNSWNETWGFGGDFFMEKDDFASVFANQGELLAAVEIAHAA